MRNFLRFARFSVLALLIVQSTLTRAEPAHWINDGSERAPRLSVEQAIWAMRGLPRGGPEWSREDKISNIAKSGFDGFMLFLPREPGERNAYRDLAAKHGLALTLQCAPSTVAELDEAIAAAKEMNARGLVAMIRPTFVTFDEGAEKIRAMSARCREAKLPFYVETHRRTITQDLVLTGRWARELPGIQLHADLSHFVISYGVNGPVRGEIKAAFDAVLARTGMVDGRIGNGAQAQIDVGDKGDTQEARRFAGWWKQAMVAWLKNARPGDVFVFKSELGPPPYSIVGPDGVELSDRWAQALVVRDLGIRTWNSAVAEAGVGTPYQAGVDRASLAAATPPKAVGPGAARKPRGKDWGKWPAALEPKPSKIRVLRGVSHQLGDFHLAGQPAQPDFYTAQDEGVKTVINVRMARELFGLGFDEDVAVEELGIKYIHMPVAPQTFDEKAANEFLAAVRAAKKKGPVLIHGSNANRVWGLWALYIGMEHGVPLEVTRKKAAELGVKKLVVDKAVAEYLSKHQGG